MHNEAHEERNFKNCGVLGSRAPHICDDEISRGAKRMCRIGSISSTKAGSERLALHVELSQLEMSCRS